MDIHTLNHVLAQMSERNKKYLEFIRVPALSVGVYRLEAGAKDEQRPHSEDEVYYVISGRAKFTCAGKETEARAGSILFVERGGSTGSSTSAKNWWCWWYSGRRRGRGPRMRAMSNDE